MSKEGSTQKVASLSASQENKDDDGHNSQVVENESIVVDIPALHTAKRLKIEARKLDGMQRELYSLIGDSAPPVVVTPDSKFKNRPEWQQKAAPWKLVEFEPKPGLTLKHWVRASSITDGVLVNRFAQFNKETEVPSWSEEDYCKFQNDDWSLEESQYLFRIAKEYDLRWLVIHDRYEWKNKQRTIEDLKDRYYEICRILIKTRPISSELGLSPHDEELLTAMGYDKALEVKRKAHLERLLSRTPKEVAEEEALILEARRLESMGDKILRERQEFLRIFESPAPLNGNTSKIDLNTSHGVGQLLQELQNEKPGKKASSSGTASSATTSATTVSGSSAARKTVAKIVGNVLNRKMTERDEKILGISYTDAAKIKSPGVFLRSSKLTPVRQNILPKVRAITSELGIPLRPIMPTAKICSRYESLYQSISVLLEAKKIQDKLVMEIEVLKRAKEKQTEGTIN